MLLEPSEVVAPIASAVFGEDSSASESLGRIPLRVRVDRSLRRDIVAAEEGWWHGDGIGPDLCN